MKITQQKQCQECMFHRTGGTNEYCKYFETEGRDKKEIPSHIIEIGCRYYKDKDVLVSQVIERFDGTFI